MNVPEGAKIYVACGYTDMRKQIDGLAQLVEQNFHLSPFDNVFFLFCGRRRDRLKALYWEGDGFLLLYKRLNTFRYHSEKYGKERMNPMIDEEIDKLATLEEKHKDNQLSLFENERKRNEQERKVGGSRAFNP